MLFDLDVFDFGPLGDNIFQLLAARGPQLETDPQLVFILGVLVDPFLVVLEGDVQLLPNLVRVEGQQFVLGHCDVALHWLLQKDVHHVVDQGVRFLQGSGLEPVNQGQAVDDQFVVLQ